MQNEDLEIFPDGIGSKDAPVARWLKLIYLVLPIWGVVTFFIYWNGSHGWLDRGYWGQLQRAANTTFPEINMNDPEVIEQIKENPELHQSR